jgi:hypothetical protein
MEQSPLNAGIDERSTIDLGSPNPFIKFRFNIGVSIIVTANIVNLLFTLQSAAKI